MARPKTRSDEIYNERRRAKRLAARIEAQTFRTKQEKAQAAAYVERLNKAIANTYAKRDGGRASYSEKTQRQVAALSQVTRRGVRTAQDRRNTIFASDINLASRQADSNIASSGDKDEALGMVKIFYQSTRSLWEGVPKEERNNAILMGLGLQDLGEAFKYVLGNNQDALRRLQANLKGTDDTADDDFFNQSQDEREGSPDYMLMVRDITMVA